MRAAAISLLLLLLLAAACDAAKELTGACPEDLDSRSRVAAVWQVCALS